jgi:hypothetical protein
MAWISVQHAMLHFFGIWALGNLSAITGLGALFLFEGARSGRLRRRNQQRRSPVIPISRR